MSESAEAYRIEQSNGDRRAKWLADRLSGIGGSDAPVVLGLSKWMSRFELWQLKAGAVKPEDREDDERMTRGHVLEPIVLRLLALKTGRTVEAAEPFKIIRNENHPWCFCTPDGWEREKDDFDDRQFGEGIVQAKTADSFTKHEWEDESSDTFQVYWTQIQHEMLATGCSWGTLCVLFCDIGTMTRMLNAALSMGYPKTVARGLDIEYVVPDSTAELAEAIVDHCDFRYFDIEADAEFQADLAKTEKAFWDSIAAGIPPSVDGSESTKRCLRRLHPKDDGETVALGVEMLEHTARLSELKAAKSSTEKEIAALENRIRAAIGGATFGAMPDGSKWSLKTQTRKEHIVAASEFRVLKHSKGKE